MVRITLQRNKRSSFTVFSLASLSIEAMTHIQPILLVEGGGNTTKMGKATGNSIPGFYGYERGNEQSMTISPALSTSPFFCR